MKNGVGELILVNHLTVLKHKGSFQFTDLHFAFYILDYFEQRSLAIIQGNKIYILKNSWIFKRPQLCVAISSAKGDFYLGIKLFYKLRTTQGRK